jgi:glycosyltransferase involved in cell wall biosynthesis
MKISVVLTTINIPRVLEEYIQNAQRYNHTGIHFVVVGDRKSPVETSVYLNSINSASFPIVYLSPERQLDYLTPFQSLASFLPFDSVQRRNIGYLYAYQEFSPDVIITIDDDNFPIEGVDYFGSHSIINCKIDAQVVSATTGWFNSCSLLVGDPNRPFYHRGFPLSKRWISENYEYSSKRVTTVKVNAGLWLGDPDVDTISRLEYPICVKKVVRADSIVVAQGVLAPFNSQNTAFASELLPFLYLPALPAGFSSPLLRGNNNFRYDDIWMSYFLKLSLDALGHSLAIGGPLVVQQRNPHDLLVDLEKEIIPMRLTDRFADDFANIKLSGSTYLECYRDLLRNLRLLWDTSLKNTKEDTEVLHRFVDGMEIWADVCHQIGIV